MLVTLIHQSLTLSTELIGPAVCGTIGILQSALSHGYVVNLPLLDSCVLPVTKSPYEQYSAKIKRVVITSSIVAAISLIEHRLAGNKALTLTEVCHFPIDVSFGLPSTDSSLCLGPHIIGGLESNLCQED